MRTINSKFLFFSVLLSCFLFSCEKEGAVFVGQWQDSRTPENVWEITQVGSVFKGQRISGDDFYKYDKEEWTFEIGRTGAPTLVPANKDEGSTLMYQVKENRFLRHPPGRSYVKIIKEK